MLVSGRVVDLEKCLQWLTKNSVILIYIFKAVNPGTKQKKHHNVFFVEVHDFCLFPFFPSTKKSVLEASQQNPVPSGKLT